MRIPTSSIMYHENTYIDLGTRRTTLALSGTRRIPTDLSGIRRIPARSNRNKENTC